MERPYLEVQRDLNNFLTRHRDRINAYHEEMRIMFTMDEDDPLRAKMKPAIIEKYKDVVYPLSALEEERERAYHEQKDRLSTPGRRLLSRQHVRARVDASHPASPYGEERQKEGWTPETSRVFGPGGSLESPKVIVIPS